MWYTTVITLSGSCLFLGYLPTFPCLLFLWTIIVDQESELQHTGCGNGDQTIEETHMETDSHLATAMEFSPHTLRQHHVTSKPMFEGICILWMGEFSYAFLSWARWKASKQFDFLAIYMCTCFFLFVCLFQPKRAIVMILW